MNQATDKFSTPIKESKKEEISKPQPIPKKKKKKKKSFKNLMRSLTKSSLTEKQRIQKQKERLNQSFVDVNFKKVDVI